MACRRGVCAPPLPYHTDHCFIFPMSTACAAMHFCDIRHYLVGRLPRAPLPPTGMAWLSGIPLPPPPPCASLLPSPPPPPLPSATPSCLPITMPPFPTCPHHTLPPPPPSALPLPYLPCHHASCLPHLPALPSTLSGSLPPQVDYCGQDYGLVLALAQEKGQEGDMQLCGRWCVMCVFEWKTSSSSSSPEAVPQTSHAPNWKQETAKHFALSPFALACPCFFFSSLTVCFSSLGSPSLLPHFNTHALIFAFGLTFCERKNTTHCPCLPVEEGRRLWLFTHFDDNRQNSSPFPKQKNMEAFEDKDQGQDWTFGWDL